MKTTALFALVALSAGPLAAATLDFETVTTQSVARFGASVVFGGVTVSSRTEANGSVVRVGGDTDAFVPNDSPLNGAFGA